MSAHLRYGRLDQPIEARRVLRCARAGSAVQIHILLCLIDVVVHLAAVGDRREDRLIPPPDGRNPPLRVDRRKQHVRVRVPEVGVDAPPSADDVVRVASHVVDEPEPRLERPARLVDDHGLV